MLTDERLEELRKYAESKKWPKLQPASSIFSLIAEMDRLKGQLAEANGLLIDVYNQSCRQDKMHGAWIWDHGCISSYEDAQEYLIEHRLIDPQYCSRR